MEDDRLACEPGDEVRVEIRIGGEELPYEAFILERAAEHDELEVGQCLREVDLRLRVHNGHIGDRETRL